MTDETDSDVESRELVFREFLIAVRKEALSVAAKWTIATVTFLLAAAIIGWWLYLKEAIKEWVGALPASAIVLFDTPCSGSWKPLTDANGKYIRVMNPSIPQIGGGDFLLNKNHIPAMALTTTVDNKLGDGYALWGNYGEGGEGKRYSFSERTAGVNGVASYPLSSLIVGNANPAPIKVEPSYYGAYLCKKGT